MTTESAAQDRYRADNVYDDMRHLINTMSSVPGEFNLEELARIAVGSADHYTLVRMAMDMLLHKGRQHCGGKIRRPDGEEGVTSDASRGRFPRAVPVDRRGTSTWVGWSFSDQGQRYDAMHRRASQARGLETEAGRIRAELERQQMVAIDPAGEGATVTYHREGETVVIDSYDVSGVSINRNDVRPNPNVAEKDWGGGGWLFGTAPEYHG